MKQLITYLTFSGNCQNAMKFYQNCLGGDLYFQTIEDSPNGKNLPDQMKSYIVHAELKSENFILMATDMVEEKGLNIGNAISILIDCDSKDEMEILYNKLSENGEISFPISETYWGAFFGGLKDKFGNNWLLNYKQIL